MPQDDDIKDALKGTIERQLAETKTGNPGATSSPAEESPVNSDEVAQGSAGAGDQTATRADAATPGDVGTSTTRRAEDVVEEEGQDAGRYTTGTQGESQRPVGESTASDSTGIDAQEPSGGPTMPASGSSAGS